MLSIAGPGTGPTPIETAHKAVIMRCIEAICDDGQLLVDVFVNYDCDLEGANLFERLIAALVRIAQGAQEKENQASVSIEESNLRLAVSHRPRHSLLSLPPYVVTECSRGQTLLILHQKAVSLI